MSGQLALVLLLALGCLFGGCQGIAMPLDRTGTNAEYENALLERNKRQRAVETTRLKVASEARQAVRQVERARELGRMADAAVALAREETEIARFRYQRGLSNNLDLVNAEASLLSADARRIAALADAALAQLALRAAMGVLEPSDIR